MQVREYALLTTNPDAIASIDVGSISPATFDWLLTVTGSWSRDIKILYDRGHRALKLGSLVGYLCSPTGEEIEVLPKTQLGKDNPQLGRQVLCDMLRTSVAPKSYESGNADLMKSNEPVHEWICQQFLLSLQALVAYGLRFDYIEVREEAAFIRGRIDMMAQQRQRPGSAHRFQLHHEIFSPDRLENRLLKTALMWVKATCRSAQNWRMCNVLAHQLKELPTEPDIANGLRRWSTTRQMQPYNNIKPWCELILRHINPKFQKGLYSGVALLFPMERLFESHVQYTLVKDVRQPWTVKAQARSRHLIQNHDTRRLFELRPDLLLQKQGETQVLDTKWKLLNQDNLTDKYNLKQDDFYQLYAYGHNYQNGSGDMLLIYPKHDGFTRALAPFNFDRKLTVWAVPFCLQTQKLVLGDWVENFPALGVSS